MKKILVYISILYLVVSCNSDEVLIQNENIEIELNTKEANIQKKALEAIYYANPNNTLDWDMSEENIANWSGVSTNSTGEVIHLNLGNKNLDVLPPEIAYLSTISTLYLNGNNLNYLPAQIGKVSNLRQLYIQNNELSDLPNRMIHLTKLSDLQMSFNNFTEIPIVVGKLKSLKVLNASHNEINAILPSIYKLPNLEILGLFKNNVSSVSSDIKYLKLSLIDLNLGRNILTSIPKEISYLSYLKKLYLHQNDLLSVPYQIGALESIEFIDLRDNLNLNNIPDEVCELNSKRQTIVYIDNWFLCF